MIVRWSNYQHWLIGALVGLGTFWLAGCVSGPAGGPSGRRCHFLALTNFTEYERLPGPSSGQVVLLSPPIETPFAWDELVLSWNIDLPPGTALQLEVRAFPKGNATRFYTMGFWSEDPSRYPRKSVNGQQDKDGAVDTDTLLLRRTARTLQLRLTFTGFEFAGRLPLKFLGLSLLDSQGHRGWREANRGVWGRTLAVPEKSQLGYPGARGWCSPTSVAMVLAYWGKQLDRPELDLEVSEVATGVQDPAREGTGNWAFNVAFAGRFPGLRAYVARLRDLRELEDWVAAGVPPVASVSSALLRGRSRDTGNGHLVVCIGFTSQGDVIVNDPWADLPKGEPVRRICPRSVFVRAWERSKFTAYLIYPEPPVAVAHAQRSL